MVAMTTACIDFLEIQYEVLAHMFAMETVRFYSVHL